MNTTSDQGLNFPNLKSPSYDYIIKKHSRHE